MEQWHLARAQSPPGSPSDTLRQVATSSRLGGMECGGDTNTRNLRLGFEEVASCHFVVLKKTQLNPTWDLALKVWQLLIWHN